MHEIRYKKVQNQSDARLNQWKSFDLKLFQAKNLLFQIWAFAVKFWKNNVKKAERPKIKIIITMVHFVSVKTKKTRQQRIFATIARPKVF